MSADIHAWLAKQIDRYSVVNAETRAVVLGDPTAMTRLADAAAVLARPRAGGQAFGLELPAAGIEGGSELADRCLAALAEWAPLLDPRNRAEIGAQLERLGLPPIVPRTRPSITHRLSIFVPARALDHDTEELIEDPTALAELEGVPESRELSLADLPLIAALGGWICDGRARLTYDESGGGLRCELAFDLTREPGSDDIERLRQVVGGELLFTSWGMNLSWDFEEGDGDYMIETDPKVVAHELVRIDATSSGEG